MSASALKQSKMPFKSVRRKGHSPEDRSLMLLRGFSNAERRNALSGGVRRRLASETLAFVSLMGAK